jgi:hypothetical protein
MTIAIRYDSDTGHITNRYYVGPKDEAEWVNTDDSDWPDPNVARDELPVFYYDESTDEITVQGERQVTAGIRLSVSDTQLANDGTDAVTVAVTLVNEFVDPTQPFDDIAILDRNENLAMTVDGSEMTKTLSNGTLSFDVTTQKSAGTSIDISADHPDVSATVSARIEVIQG